MAPIPDWLERKLREKPALTRDARPLSEVVQGVSKGERNIQAARMVGKLIGCMPPRDWEPVVWPLIVAWNRQNRPPLPAAELRGVFQKISDREVRKALRQPKSRDLQERIKKVLRNDPTISERAIRRKLNANRYGRAFDLVLHHTLKRQHSNPQRPLMGVCIT